MSSKRNKTTLEPKMITVLTNWGRHIQVPANSVKNFARTHPEEYIHYEGPVPEQIISTPKPIFTIGALAAIRQARKAASSPETLTNCDPGESNYV